MIFYSIIALIMSNALNTKRDTTILYSRITILVFIFSFFFFYNAFYYNYINSGIIILNGLLCIENYTFFFSMFIILLSMFILGITSVFYLRKQNKLNWKNIVFSDIMSEHYRLAEYPLIILFCVIGTIFLMFSFDIITVFLSIELQSYALYIICSIYRNSESSTNAGLTYFLLGGLSSCIILLGLALLYVNTGNTNLENLYILNSVSDVFFYSTIYGNLINNDMIDLISSINSQYIFIQISLLVMSIGFLFKIGSAPFHFWSPDVYDAVPTVSTTFISIVPKISVLVFLYKIIFFTSSNIISLSWINNLIFSSILSLVIGSILGLSQFRIKRLYAYSTISHIGFILIALSINNLESSKAFFFYLIQYSISNLNAFLILLLIGFTLKNYILDSEHYLKIKVKDINYSPVQLISQLKGYYNINPILSISLSITLFSFAGIPPLVGFFGKQLVLTSALNTNLFFITIIAIICSVISAVYYLLVVKVMCFESQKLELNVMWTNSKYTFSSFFSFTISILTLLIVFFFIFEYDLIQFLNILLISIN